MQLYTKVDLLALSAFGGSPRDLGYYGAAQNLSIAPGLLSVALAPLLLATLTRAVRSGHRADADVISRGGLRVALGMLPFAAIVAGTSSEVVGVIFGPDYAPAGPLLALLFAAAVAIAVMSVAVAILTAANHARLVSVLGVSVVGAAIAGHFAFIPRFGALGAASVTAVTGGLGAMLMIVLVQRVWGVHAHTTTLRAMLIAVPAYWAAAVVETPGVLALSAKLALLSIAVVAAFAGLGEFDRSERAAIRSALQERWTARG
jgi:O-antigen/teichoic acid export membrane protein